MIPIYRAKKTDSGEYVEGQYLVYKGYPTIFNEYGLNGIEIDISTLSIHFPDISTTSENVWYNMEEISKLLKEYENGKMETN